MKVAVLQQYLRSLIDPLTASGATQKVTNDLEQTSQALEPFRDHDFAQIVAFLVLAEEAHRTGVPIPKKPSGRRSPPKTAVPADIPHLAQQVRQLEETAMEADMTVERLNAALDQLRLEKLKKPETVDLAKELGVSITSKTTAKQVVTYVRQLVESRRTGVPPTPMDTPKPRKPAASTSVDPARIQQLAQQVRQLEEMATETDMTRERLNAALDQLGLEKLTKPEAVAVANELNHKANARTSLGKAIEMIRGTVLTRKAALETANT